MWQTRYRTFKPLQTTARENVYMLSLCDETIAGKGG